MVEVIDLTGQTFFGLGTQFDPLLNCLPVGDAWNDWLQYPHGSDPVVVHRHGKYLVSSNTRPGVSRQNLPVLRQGRVWAPRNRQQILEPS